MAQKKEPLKERIRKRFLIKAISKKTAYVNKPEDIAFLVDDNLEFDCAINSWERLGFDKLKFFKTTSGYVNIQILDKYNDILNEKFKQNLKLAYKDKYYFYLVQTNATENAEIIRRYSSIGEFKILPKVVTTIKTALNKNSIACILAHRDPKRVYREFYGTKGAFIHTMCILQDVKKLHDAGLRLKREFYSDEHLLGTTSISYKVFNYISLNDDDDTYTFEDFARNFIRAVFNDYCTSKMPIRYTSNRYEYSYWITEELYNALRFSYDYIKVDFYLLIKEQFVLLMDEKSHDIKEKYWLTDNMYGIEDSIVPIYIDEDEDRYKSKSEAEKEKENMVCLYLRCMNLSKEKKLLRNNPVSRHFSKELKFLGFSFAKEDRAINMDDFLYNKKRKENMLTLYTAIYRTVLNFLFLIENKVKIWERDLKYKVDYKIHFSRNIDIHKDLYFINNNGYPYFILKDYSIFEVGCDESKNVDVMAKFILDLLAETSDYEVFYNDNTHEMEVIFKSFSLINYLDIDIITDFERYVTCKSIEDKSNFVNNFIDSIDNILEENSITKRGLNNCGSDYERYIDALDEETEIIFPNSFSYRDIPVVLLIHENNTYDSHITENDSSLFMEYMPFSVKMSKVKDYIFPNNTVCIIATRYGDIAGYIVEKPKEYFRILSPEFFNELDEMQIIKLFSNLYKMSKKLKLNMLNLSDPSRTYPKINKSTTVDKDLDIFFSEVIELVTYNDFIKQLEEFIYKIRSIKGYKQTTIEVVIRNNDIIKLLSSYNIEGTYSEKYNIWYFFNDTLQIGQFLYEDCEFVCENILHKICSYRDYEIFSSGSYNYVIRYVNSDIDIKLIKSYMQEFTSCSILRDSLNFELYGIEIYNVGNFLDVSLNTIYNMKAWDIYEILYDVIAQIVKTLKSDYGKYFALNASMCMDSLSDVFFVFDKPGYDPYLVIVNPIINVKKDEIDDSEYNNFCRNSASLINKIFDIMRKADEVYGGEIFKYYVSLDNVEELLQNINNCNNIDELFNNLEYILSLFIFSDEDLFNKNYCKYHNIHFDFRFKGCPKCKEEFGDNVIFINEDELTENYKKGGESLIYDHSEYELYKLYRKDSKGKYLVDINAKIGILRYWLNLKEDVEKDTKGKPFSIVLPNNLLRGNKKSQICGFSMDKIKHAKPISVLTDIEYAQNRKWTNIHIIKILINLGMALEYLNKNGWYIGDFNGGNVLFDENNYHVYIIDTDSLGGANGNTPTKFVQSFLDPKASVVDGNVKVNINTDYYSYALISFSCLTGLHPFGGVYRENGKIVPMEVRMKREISVLRKNKIKLPNTIFKWNWMSDRLEDAFFNIFEGTERYSILPILNDELNILKGSMPDKLKGEFSDIFGGAESIQPILNDEDKQNRAKDSKHDQNVKLEVWYEAVKNKNVKIFPSMIVNESRKNLYDIVTGRFIQISGSFLDDKIKNIFFSKKGRYYIVVKDSQVIAFSNLHLMIFKKDIRVGSSVFFSYDGNYMYILDDKKYVSKYEISHYSCEEIEIQIDVAPIATLENFQLSKDGEIGVSLVKNKHVDTLEIMIFDLMDNGEIIDSFPLDNIDSADNIYIDTLNSRDIFVFDNSNKKGIFAKFDKDSYELSYLNIDEWLTDNATLYKNILFYPKDSKIVAINLKTLNKKEFDCSICNENCKLIRITSGFKIIDKDNSKVYKYTV